MDVFTTVTTPPCLDCGKTTALDVTEDEWFGIVRWVQGAFIQDALPNWSADKHELLMTGMHAECWNRTFPDE